MKIKFLFPLWLAICALFLYGCTEDIDEPAFLSGQDVVDTEHIALIEAMGFKTDDIYVTNDAYWVEGDVVITKDYLEDLKDKPKTRQNYYGDNHLVDQSKVRNIRVAVNPNYSYDSETAMSRFTDALLTDVFKAFNDLADCAVNISKVAYSSNSNDYDILIEEGVYQFDQNYSVHQEMICSGEIPDGNGSPGNRIYINSQPYYSGYPSAFWEWKWITISEARIKTALIHAIGHCLGLAHTGRSQSAPNLSGGFSELEESHPWIKGTLWDNGLLPSIMDISEHNFNNSVASFSDDDKKALAILYPAFGGGQIAMTGGMTTTVITADIVPPQLINVEEAVGGSGTITYQWQESADGTTSWEDIPNSTSMDSCQPPALSATTYYRRRATSGSATAFSNVISIIIFNPAVTGPDNPFSDVTMTYGISATFPAGVAFGGWTIPGKRVGIDYSATNGMNNLTLPIIFLKSGQYTLTANFTISVNTAYSISKTVDAMPYYEYFSFQTVTGNTTFAGDYDIISDNVIVENGASLTLQARAITIMAPFEVEGGATFVMTR